MWCGAWDARVCIGRAKIVPCLFALECFVCSMFAVASLTLCDNRTNAIHQVPFLICVFVIPVHVLLIQSGGCDQPVCIENESPM